MGWYQDYVNKAVEEWKATLDVEDFDEDASAELLNKVQILSPEAYEQIKVDYNHEEIMKRYE